MRLCIACCLSGQYSLWPLGWRTVFKSGPVAGQEQRRLPSLLNQDHEPPEKVAASREFRAPTEQSWGLCCVDQPQLGRDAPRWKGKCLGQPYSEGRCRAPLAWAETHLSLSSFHMSRRGAGDLGRLRQRRLRGPAGRPGGRAGAGAEGQAGEAEGAHPGDRGRRGRG